MRRATRDLVLAGVAVSALLTGAVKAQAAVAPATLVGHTVNWLERQGHDVGPVGLVWSSPGATVTDRDGKEWHMVDWATAVSVPGKVIFGPAMREGLEALAARYGERGRLEDQAVQAAETLLHELVHQHGVEEFETGTQTDRFYEEGAAIAVARDLLPAFLRELYGHRLGRRELAGRERRPSNQSTEVKQVRVLSVFGSAGGKWTAKEAKAWRASFVRAGYETRRAMVAQAVAAANNHKETN